MPVERHMTLLDQPFDESGMQSLEDRVLWDDGEDIMKIDIRLLELSAVAECRVIGFEGQPQRFDFVRRRALGGMARKPDLQKAARLLEVPDALRRRQQITNAAGKILDNRLWRRGRHPRPRAGLQFDQSHP